jgi:DUF1009 family protein
MDEYPNILPLRPGLGQKVGLLAGWGSFPISFAKAAREQGYSVYCSGIEGMASESLRDICDDVMFAGLGKLGKSIRYFKRNRVDRVVMAGKVEKTVIYDPFRLLKYLPDWRTLHMWYRYARENRKDDTILLAVIREYARDNIHFESALNFCPELLVRHGFLTKRQPTAAQWKDIRFGFEMAKEMGRLDVGQTVVVSDMAVVAVEAIEGTDECIRRSGTLCRRGGQTVVKVAKPQQDMRFDVPAIGLKTLQSMREAGARVLAIESGMTIILDEPEVIELANKLGIVIVSVKSEELQMRMAS